MFARIVLGHNHKRSIGIDSIGLHPYSVFVRRRVHKGVFIRRIICVTFMYSSWWPAILQRVKKTSNENYV